MSQNLLGWDKKYIAIEHMTMTKNKIKTKGTKKCVIKWKPKSKNYEYCLEATKLENKISQLEKKG